MSENKKKKKPAETQSGGIHINAPVTAGTMNVANRDINQTINQGMSALDPKILEEWFAPVKEQIQALPPALQPVAEQQAQELQEELGNGKEADPSRLNTLVDGLIALVPGAVSGVAAMFGQPILAGLVGPVTGEILKRITGG